MKPGYKIENAACVRCSIFLMVGTVHGLIGHNYASSLCVYHGQNGEWNMRPLLTFFFTLVNEVILRTVGRDMATFTT